MAHPLRRVLGAAARRARSIPISPRGDPSMASTKTKEQPSLSIVRKLDTGPAKVWRAITEPEMLKQWMAPSDAFKVPVAETDVRVGGRYRIVMNRPRGAGHDVSCV